LCRRIVIMDNGKDLVTGTTEELKKMITTSEIIVVTFPLISEELINELRNLPRVIDIDTNDEEYIIKFENGVNNLSNLLEFINEHNLSYTSLHSKLPTLNEVFLELTGKELRD
ncbi:MAG TPA: DUF4162 domain-containing protein, partial [Halanaerobiales bacterium]|nr:DUF4162 domain-containing protein [Halanaerobiales bacterium]